MSRFYDADGPDKRITTVNEYLDVYPDPDPFGVLHFEGDELRRETARCSPRALPASVVAAWGTAAAPTPDGRVAPSPRAPVGEPTDVSSLGANDAEAA